VGSQTSSNSKRLVEVAEREGSRAYLVDDETDVDVAWLKGASTVAVTAGASAPESLVRRLSLERRGSSRHPGVPAWSAPLASHRSCQVAPGWPSSQSSSAPGPARA